MTGCADKMLYQRATGGVLALWPIPSASERLLDRLYQLDLQFFIHGHFLSSTSNLKLLTHCTYRADLNLFFQASSVHTLQLNLLM